MAQTASISVIPNPVSARMLEGDFRLTPKTTVLFEPDSPEIRSIARRLAEKLGGATGYDLTVEKRDRKKTTANTILLSTAEAAKRLGDEGYELRVTPKNVAIRASKPAGVFYGVQTLHQLFPPELEAPNPSPSAAWTVPCVEIEDRPRFAWRGMHLDVARHFFDKEFVLHFLKKRDN